MAKKTDSARDRNCVASSDDGSEERDVLLPIGPLSRTTKSGVSGRSSTRRTRSGRGRSRSVTSSTKLCTSIEWTSSEDEPDDEDECSSPVAHVSAFWMFLHGCFPNAFPIPGLFWAHFESAGGSTAAAGRGDGRRRGKTLVPAPPDDRSRPAAAADLPGGMIVREAPGYRVTGIRFQESGRTYREAKRWK